MPMEPKERILATTIELLEEADSGEPSLRDIAKEAGVGLGLINYHFGSRENLIREAVRIHINRNVIAAYSPPRDADPLDSLAGTISGVLDYLALHPKLARVSILNDLAHPAEDDNTSLSFLGFKATIARLREGGTEGGDSFAAWMIVAAIHEAFLRPDRFKAEYGLSWGSSSDRRAFAGMLARIALPGPREPG